MSMPSDGETKRESPDTLPDVPTSGIPFTAKSPTESATAANTLGLACETVQRANGEFVPLLRSGVILVDSRPVRPLNDTEQGADQEVREKSPLQRLQEVTPARLLTGGSGIRTRHYTLTGPFIDRGFVARKSCLHRCHRDEAIQQ